MTAPRINHKSLVYKPNSKTKIETRIYSALLLTLAIFVLLATHLTQQPAPWGSGSPASKTSLVRAHDKQFLAGKNVYGDDEYSYASMAQSPGSGSYLNQRAPFSYRIAGPAIVWSIQFTGLSLIDRFFLLNGVGILVAVFALYWICLDMGVDPQRAAWSSALFLFLPPVLEILRAPVRVDGMAWGLMFLAWWAWRRDLLFPTIFLLTAAMLFRETAVLLIPCVWHDAYLRRRGNMAPAILTISACAVLLVTHLAIGPSSSSIPIIYYIGRVLRNHWNLLRHGQALFDLTIFAGGLVICLFVVSWRVFLDRRIVPLLWLAPSALLLVLVSFDLGRVVVSVALLTLPAASLAISQFRRPRVVMAATLLLSGAVGLARTTSLYESGGHLLIAISVVTLIAVAILLRKRADSELSGRPVVEVGG